MKKQILILALVLISISSLANRYDVTDFGALGDGKTIDSPAINAAIEAASEKGGGMIYFPAGTYLSYSIRLKSNIHLYLESGAVLEAAQPSATEGYDPAEPSAFTKFQDFGHSHFQNSLIWGEKLENIQISGFGLIYGRGLSREESRIPGAANKAIALSECVNVTISDINMLKCGHFALLATGVENMTLRNMRVDTNRDGFDIDCCRNVRISDCSINAPWDDALVLKASYALGRFKDTENVTITNCFVSGFDQGTMLSGTYERDEPQAPDHGFNTGRIKFGTESSGGFKNITISNCVFENCRGIALESVDGGFLEDICITNISMRDIVNSPIFLRLGSRMRSPEGTPMGKMRRITISNINCYDADGRYSCILSGVPGHPIEDVYISGVRILYKGGGTSEMAGLTPPENIRGYPEPWMFGTIPASGFFIRHVKNLHMRDVELDYMTDEARPTFYLDDVENIRLDAVRSRIEPKVQRFIQKDVRGLIDNP
ncbi:MAG: glycoside hydrolase family 28 protein [Bacteroidales bacterium]